MAGCNEHVECLQEKIADYRHLEDIGLVFISIGIASLSLLTIPGQIVTAVLMLFGTFLFIFGGWKKGKNEAKLCELLKRLPK
jgi:hypothetical protein